MAELTYQNGQVVLADPDGNVGLVDPAHVQDYLQQGFTPVGNKELSQAEAARAEQERLTSVQAKVGTGLRAVAEGAGAPINWAAKKLGAPDLFEAGLTPEQIEENRKMAEANPLSEAAGHIVGELAGMKGLGITKGAHALGGLTKNAIARGAITGATEGAGLGVIGEMERDPDADAESLLAGGALGALLGGGTGAVFAGAGRGLEKIFGRASSLESELAAEGVERGTPAWQEKLKSTYNDWVSKITNTDKKLLEDVGAFGKRRAEAELAAQTLDENINRAALDLQGTITRVDEGVTNITRTVRDSSMKEESLRKIGGSNFNTVERERASKLLVDQTYKEVAPQLEALEAFEAANPEVRIPAQTRRELNALRDELEAATERSQDESADALTNYMLANGMKQKIDEVVKGLRNDVVTNKMTTSSFQRKNMLGIAQGLQGAVDKTREALQSEKLWGKAIASAQRDVNQIWHEGAIRALNNFGKNFMRNTGEEAYETGRYVFENDPAQTAAALRKLGTAEGFMAERAMGQYIQSVGELVHTIGKRYNLQGAQKQLVEDTLEQIGKINEVFGDIKGQSQLAERYGKMLKIEREHSAIANQLPLLGGLLGGPLGAGAGAVARQLMQPASTAQLLGNVSRAGERLGTLTRGVGNWLAKGGEAIADSGGSRTARNIGVSAALKLFRGKHDNDYDAFDARAKTIQAVNVEGLGPHIDGLPANTQMSAGGQASKAIQYLQSLLPSGGSPSIMNPSRKLEVSPIEKQRFALAWATLVDPSTAVHDFKNGRLSPVQVQTLKAVYPRLYDDLRFNALQGLARADASGTQIPLHVRQEADVLLDLHGAGQPAFSDQITGIIQQGLATQTAPKPPARQKVPQLAKGRESSSAKLLSA